MPGGRREQRAIRGTKLRPCHLAPQYLELVAQDEQLEVLDVEPTARSDDRAQQGPEREVEERESHTGDRSSPRPGQARHEYWRPSRLDYIETIRQWRKRFATPSLKKKLLKLQLLPRWLTSADFRLAFTSGVSANTVCFERELLDHYRLVFEKDG